MDNARYNNFIKTASNFISKFLWVCSIWFSVFGLVGTLTEGTHLPTWLKAIFVVISIGLGVTVTVLELMANRRNLRETFETLNVGDLLLFLFQMLAYVYDGYTNIAGLTFFVLGSANFVAIPMSPALAACWFFGLLIAGGPEPIYMASMAMKYLPVAGGYRPVGSPTSQGQYSGSGLSKEQLERLAALRQAQQNKGR